MFVLALAVLLPSSCGTPPVRIAEVRVTLEYSTDAWDVLRLTATVVNDRETEFETVYARIVTLDNAVVSGKTDTLLFRHVPGRGTRDSENAIRLLRWHGDPPFDPARLGWLVVTGDHDTDRDGLPDGEELALGLDPAHPDSDADHAGDGVEVRLFGTAPESEYQVPAAFPSGVFYALGTRANGEPALVLAAPGEILPRGPLFLGRPGAVGTGLAADRHGFLAVARDAELLHVDPLTGETIGGVPLRYPDGTPADVGCIAFDPVTNALHGVARDPETGETGLVLATIDPVTGVVVEDGPLLPGPPLAMAFHPDPDPADGGRLLLVAVEDSSGGWIHEVRIPDGAARPWSHLPAGTTGMAFDDTATLMLAIQHHDDGSVRTSVRSWGGPGSYDIVYELPLEGLAIPARCPAPCFTVEEHWEAEAGHGIAAADLDDDGDIDAVSGFQPTADGYALALLRNDGTGAFVRDGAFPLPGEPRDLALADLDGDGALDVVLAIEDEVYVLPADGAGFAPAEPIGPIFRRSFVGDVTGDGAPDLLSFDSLYVNDGGGRFASAALPWLPLAPPVSVSLAQLDGVGALEIVVVHEGPGDTSSITAFGTDGAGGWVERSHARLDVSTAALGAGDLDADGRADVVVVGFAAVDGEWRSHAFLLRGSADGGLGPPEPVPGLLGVEIAVADVTGDGHADVVLSEGTLLRVLIGDGSGGLRPAPFPGPADHVEFVLADVDGNGHADVLQPAGFLRVLRSFAGGLDAPGGGLADVSVAALSSIRSPTGVSFKTDVYVSWDEGGDYGLGSDANDGLSPLTPIRSLVRLGQLVTALPEEAFPVRVLVDAGDVGDTPDGDYGLEGPGDHDGAVFGPLACTSGLCVWVTTSDPTFQDRWEIDCAGTDPVFWGDEAFFVATGGDIMNPVEQGWVVLSHGRISCYSRAFRTPGKEGMDLIRSEFGGKVLVSHMELEHGGFLDQAWAIHGGRGVLGSYGGIFVAIDSQITSQPSGSPYPAEGTDIAGLNSGGMSLVVGSTFDHLDDFASINWRVEDEHQLVLVGNQVTAGGLIMFRLDPTTGNTGAHPRVTAVGNSFDARDDGSIAGLYDLKTRNVPGEHLTVKAFGNVYHSPAIWKSESPKEEAGIFSVTSYCDTVLPAVNPGNLQFVFNVASSPTPGMSYFDLFDVLDVRGLLWDDEVSRYGWVFGRAGAACNGGPCDTLEELLSTHEHQPPPALSECAPGGDCLAMDPYSYDAGGDGAPGPIDRVRPRPYCLDDDEVVLDLPTDSWGRQLTIPSWWGGRELKQIVYGRRGISFR